MRSTHAHRDERGTRLAIYVGGGIVALILILVGVGYYNDYIGPARDTAIVVGPQHISLGYYRDRLKAATIDAGTDLTQQGAYGQLSTVTDAIEEEQTYLQRASLLGVTASENDIALQMAKLVQAATQDNKISDQASYLALLRLKLAKDGLSLGQLRQIATANALKANVLAKFKSEVPKQTLAVQLHELIFTSEAQGRAAQQRLEQGDSFADIEQDTVGDPSIGQATPVDWTPVPYGILPAPIDDVASKLQPGQVSDLIKVDSSSASSADSSASGSTTTQWYLITVTNRDSNYSVPDTTATQIANKMQSDWLADQQGALRAHSVMTPSMQLWAVTHSGLPAQAPATQAPKNPTSTGGSGTTNAPTGPIGPAAPNQAQPPTNGANGVSSGAPPAATIPAVPPVPNGTP